MGEDQDAGSSWIGDGLHDWMYREMKTFIKHKSNNTWYIFYVLRHVTSKSDFETFFYDF